MENIRFDAAYSSPLSRAKKTAEVILKGRNIKIKEDNFKLLQVNEVAKVNEPFYKK